MSRVLASIVSTGEGDRVAACLTSLAQQQFEGSLSVAVVVNGIDDGTGAVTKRLVPDAHLILRARPMGFAENHDDALATASFDYGLVLNPDVVLEPGCIAKLIEGMSRHSDAGVVVPLLSFPSGAPQPSARRFPRAAGAILRRTPLRTLMAGRVARSDHYLPPPAADRPVDWALGACLFVRGAAWREIGGFDRGFRPLYVEDIDLAWRMWEAGWAVWQVPSARAMHEHQAATDKAFFDRRTLWHIHGMLRFARKHPSFLFGGPRGR